MRFLHRFLCASVSGIVFTFWLGQGVDHAVAACVSGSQCKVSDGSTQTPPSGDNFTSIGAGQNNAALVVNGNGGTIQGNNLIVNAVSAGHYAAFVGAGGSTLNLNNSSLTGDYGIYADNRFNGAASIVMNGGSITSNSRNALYLRARNIPGSSVSAVLNNVDITATGSTSEAVHISLIGTNSLTMNGGSITSASTGIRAYLLGSGINNKGANINLTNVTINSGGSLGGVVISAGSNNLPSNLNIIGGTIIHSGTANAAAVDFAAGGNVLIDGAVVKNIGGRAAVSLKGNTSNGAFLSAQNGFEFETVGDNATALIINDYAGAQLYDGKITTHGNDSIGIWGWNSSSATPLIAERVKVETHGMSAHGIYLEGGNSTLLDVDIKVNGFAYGLAGRGSATTIKMTNGSIDAAGIDAVAAYADAGAHLEFDNVKIDALNNAPGGVGLWVESGSSAVLKNNSSVTTDGASATALYFKGETETNTISIDSSRVTSQDSYAVQTRGGVDVLNVNTGSIIEGDMLVYAGDCSSNTCGSKLDFNADDSQIFGHAFVTNQARLTMNLSNNSLWTIRPSSTGVVRSDVSFVNLDDATIAFDQNGSGSFQQLWVGSGDLSGNTAVWNATGNAVLTLNTYLNDGGIPTNQSTDRLLIEGDVSGQTYVNINPIAGSPGGWTSPSGNYANSEGISIIQVSGLAAEDSFVLNGGYVTMGGLPYTYRLYAYGPGSSNGAADSAQKQVTGGTNHWDYRLQSECIGSCPVLSPAWQVAPQLANYLVASPTLFHAGLQDIGTLRQRLGDMRVSARAESELSMLSFVSQGNQSNSRAFDDVLQKTNSSMASRGQFFMRAYGGDYAYRSSLNATQYGFNADIHYAALQAGGNFYGFEAANSEVRFGLAGSYGDLSFKPNRDSSHKTKMDIWNITPYMTWAHDSGAYLDVVLSYGGFNGLVTTTVRGRTARLKGHHFIGSIEAGIPFALGSNGLTLEPQAQLIYQKLHFDKAQDVDGFPVELGNPEQITLRVGAKLTKDFDSHTKIYGKLNLIHSLDDKNTAWFGDDFSLGRGGTHVEAGIGGQVSIGKQVNLYGEANWQQRVSKGGTSGLSLNAGFNFRF